MTTKIIWFTGLSGSGKTTLSNKLSYYLKKNKKKILVIDGDKFRKKNNFKDKLSKNNILKNNYKIIKFIKSTFKKYDFVIVSVISPFLKTRLFAKKIFKNMYYEIYVYCKLSTLKKRDTKGLYKKADKKIITNLIGYKSDLKYEKSKYKKLLINTDALSKTESIKKILKKINN